VRYYECSIDTLILICLLISLLANVELEPPALAGGLFWSQKTSAVAKWSAKATSPPFSHG